MNAFDFIRETIGSLQGKRILDIGCGKGALVAALSAAGAAVKGVDPASAAIAQARRTAPNATFEESGGESLPFPDRTFDAAVFSNALHHVPAESMGTALAEAHRVTKRDGFVFVIEPLMTGSFDTVLKLINDETDVRAKAQDALHALDQDARFRRIVSKRFTIRETFANFEAFVIRAISADPARQSVVDRDRGAIEAAFRRHALRKNHALPKGDVATLDHDMKADAFVLQ